jgi:hypothetical protein
MKDIEMNKHIKEVGKSPCLNATGGSLFDEYNIKYQRFQLYCKRLILLPNKSKINF